MDIFKSIKIPITSIERQQEIVEYCENNDTLIKLLEKEIENNKKQAQLFISGIVKAKVQDNNELVDEIQQENIIETKVEKLTNNNKKPLVENNTD
jgi:hypothetical protein